ncbi:zinc finger protein 14 [Drosophila sulfurigaster albostrigata]|uniref:zinc finger protein 14 n=1 Tax=Drosophila sulfurigaster albostrigata TaxID=89887 RepID=UPI002D21AFDF|nr:zinc finger protein 14 [Drosophila sulfurigaster albostrigata]
MRGELGTNICRVCLEPNQRLQRIDESREEGEETPNEMLIQLLGISFSKLNGKEQIPDGICKQCKVELNMAFQFREKALRKQAEIEEYCRELGLLDDGDDYLVKEEQHHHQQAEDEEMNEFVINETPCGEAEADDGAQNDEYLEVDGTHEQQEVITDDIEYLEDNYTIEMNPEHEDVVLEAKYDDTATTSDIKLRRGRTRLGLNVLKADHDVQQTYEISTANADMKPRRRRVRAGLNSLRTSDGTEKGGYVCDVCGNFYEKRGRMMEHRRRHDAVYQYQCELCDAKFQVREQLRKHMYSHTGSKPFKCSYCSRQFFYESVLKSHENVHRGIKPYVCKVCDKAFAYAHSLTKHELIHSDIKLYRCDYCQKDFRLLHHMRQHEETKCHQNAVMLAETLKYEREEQEVELLAVEDVKFRLSQQNMIA